MNIIQFRNENRSCFAKVHYFFRLKFDSTIHTLAVGSLFAAPDPNLLEQSYSTVYSCQYQANSVIAFHVKTVEALVAMIPYFRITDDFKVETPENIYFLVEKPGLDTFKHLSQPVEPDVTESDEDWENMYCDE
jgi:hypothetical protein